MKDLPIKTLLHMKKYEYLIEKLKNTGIIETYAPDIIWEHIIEHDAVDLYIMLSKYFINMFRDVDHLLDVLLEIEPNYTPKLLQYLFTHTNIFDNLSQKNLYVSFITFLDTYNYESTLCLLSKYPNYSLELFKWLFIQSQLGYDICLSDTYNTYLEKWFNLHPSLRSLESLSFTNHTDLKIFIENIFPGGTRIYSIPYHTMSSGLGLLELPYNNLKNTSDNIDYDILFSYIDYYRIYHYTINKNNTCDTLCTALANTANIFADNITHSYIYDTYLFFTRFIRYSYPLLIDSYKLHTTPLNSIPIKHFIKLLTSHLKTIPKHLKTQRYISESIIKYYTECESKSESK